MAMYPYQTEPLTDFSKPENRNLYSVALTSIKGWLGNEYPLVIGGKRVKTGHIYVSTNPSDHEETIGAIHQAGVEEAEAAMQAALKAFDSWKNVPGSVRADVLFKAAQIMRRRKFELS
ncbi:MAG: aldehyde dehydrogenase family protein, partial [bacterium]